MRSCLVEKEGITDRFGPRGAGIGLPEEKNAPGHHQQHDDPDQISPPETGTRRLSLLVLGRLAGTLSRRAIIVIGLVGRLNHTWPPSGTGSEHSQEAAIL